MTILQLNPPIAVETIKGKGYANFLIDYGLESDLYWIVFQDSGEIWTWSNKDIVLQKNITAGRSGNCAYVVTENSFRFVDTWPIGCYKGHSLGDVPKGYPQYMYDCKELDDPELHDLKQTLIHLGLVDDRRNTSNTH